MSISPPLANAAPSVVGTMLRRAVPARSRPIGYLEQLTRTRTAGRVRAGPFAGMRYVGGSVGSCFIPKLLGTYERELATKIEWICRCHPKLVVDIGAAEGYYAIGLALRVPQAQVVAFELDEGGQIALSAMARLNGVADRLTVRGRCGPQDLAAALAGHPAPVVICDVEGDEEALLDLEEVPALRNATVLVERASSSGAALPTSCTGASPPAMRSSVSGRNPAAGRSSRGARLAPGCCPFPTWTGRSANGVPSPWRGCG